MLKVIPRVSSAREEASVPDRNRREMDNRVVSLRHLTGEQPLLGSSHGLKYNTSACVCMCTWDLMWCTCMCVRVFACDCFVHKCVCVMHAHTHVCRCLRASMCTCMPTGQTGPCTERLTRASACADLCPPQAPFCSSFPHYLDHA